MKHLFRLLLNSRGLGLLTLIFLLLLAIDPVIAKPANCVEDDPRPSCQNDGGDGGGGKGGMGELGNACAEFIYGGGLGTIYDDNRGEYCNGTDGQVSIPTRFRMDSKKWNKEGRKYSVWADCLPPGSGQQPTLCDGTPAEINAIQSQIRYYDDDEDGNWVIRSNDDELHFQEMEPNEVARVSMSVLVGKQRHLHFGDDQPFSRAPCRPVVDGGEVYGEPVWVRCDLDTNTDGLCDVWTVSTFKLQPGIPGIDFDLSAHACLIEGVSGVPTWENVQADFILDVCLLGVSCE